MESRRESESKSAQNSPTSDFEVYLGKKKKKEKKKKRKKKKEKKKEEGTVSRDAIARMIERCFDASPSAGVNKIQQWLASW